MSATAQLSPHISPGTKVEIHPRFDSGGPDRHGKPVTTTTTNKDGSVSLDGLIDFGRYTVLDPKTGRSVNVFAQFKTKAPVNSPEAILEETQKRAEAAKKQFTVEAGKEDPPQDNPSGGDGEEHGIEQEPDTSLPPDSDPPRSPAVDPDLKPGQSPQEKKTSSSSASGATTRGARTSRSGSSRKRS